MQIKFSCRLLIIFLLGNTLSSAVGSVQSPNFPERTYLGKWYEIARLPNNLEKNCAKPSTTTMAISKDKKDPIVVNIQCITMDGRLMNKIGVGSFVKPYQNQLSITFWPFYLRNFIFAYNDYVLHDLYSGTVIIVGSPDHKYLWIMARTENINLDKLRYTVEVAQKDGFKTNNLILNYPLIWQK